jgi:hypothetical protein
MPAENEAEILSETDETDAEHKEDPAEHPETRRSEADSPARSPVPSQSSGSPTCSASPAAAARGGHTRGGDQPSGPNSTPPRAASGQSNQRRQPAPTSTPPRATSGQSDQRSRSQSALCPLVDPLRLMLVRTKMLKALKILKTPLAPQVLMLKLFCHHHHLLEFALGYRKVYIIQSNILTVQLDMVWFPLQVKHIILQKP